jgi:hypothetical protein
MVNESPLCIKIYCKHLPIYMWQVLVVLSEYLYPGYPYYFQMDDPSKRNGVTRMYVWQLLCNRTVFIPE